MAERVIRVESACIETHESREKKIDSFKKKRQDSLREQSFVPVGKLKMAKKGLEIPANSGK